MPRKKIQKDENMEISEEMVWDMVEFARAQSGFTGIYTPDIINQRMKDITMNPLTATQEELDRALSNPKESEMKLQAFGQNFELQSMPYKRILHYLGNLPSFDLTYTCMNTKKPEEYKSPAYQKDLKIVEDFLDRFDTKKEFRTVVRQMLRSETFFGVLRDEGDRFVIQELPSEYCKITGRWDYGLLFSFNLNWFMQTGVDIDMFPASMKKAFNAYVNTNKGKQGYYPSASILDRGDNSWVNWIDLSPVDNYWGWKMSPEIASRVPYFTALFSDLVLQPLVRNLQKNQYIAAAAKLIFGEVALLNKESKATVKDAISISPDLLGKFLALMKAGVTESIKIASAPLQNVQGISFPLEDRVSMYDNYLRTALASAGINTNLIFTSDAKPNAVESQLSLNTDEQVIESLYPYFNDFLNFHVNRRTSKYKFSFKFEGSNFYTNRQQRLDTAIQLANLGIVLPQKISAAIGMNYHDFQRQLDEARINGWTENLTPIISAFNMSGDQQNGTGAKGRPKSSDSKLSDSASETRDAGSNIEKGGKV